MANRLQHLRGSEAEHSTFTGAKGEISLVTDTSANRIPTGEVRIHDGTTAGGLPLALGTTSKPLTNNIVLGSGVGINFNNYGSEDSNSVTTVGNNLLDDYEEGTWTPTVTWEANSPSYTASGRYTKIGNIVSVQIEIFVTSSGGSGIVQVTNLPFTSINQKQAGFGAERGNTGKGLVVWIDNSTTNIAMRYYDYSNVGTTNGDVMVVSAVYETQ